MTTMTKQQAINLLNKHGPSKAWGYVSGCEAWGEALDQFIPEHMQHGMFLYLAFGVETGSFIRAVLVGDLHDAVGRADEINLHCLPSYSRFLFNYAPADCFGSDKRVKEWITGGGLVGIRNANLMEKENYHE